VKSNKVQAAVFIHLIQIWVQNFSIKSSMEVPPTLLRDTLLPTVLDSNDGFVDFSTAAQTPITANLFFGNRHRMSNQDCLTVA